MGTTKIQQYIHRPNSTELGQGNTHETYLLINTSVNLFEMFPPSVETMVEDTLTNKKYLLKSSFGTEFRINQMGDIYRDYNVIPGDEIVITKIEKKLFSKLLLTVKKYDRVVLIVGSNGIELLNKNKLNKFATQKGDYIINVYDRGQQSSLNIKYKESRKKRSDSPGSTDFYDAILAGKPLVNGTYYLTISDKSTLVSLVKSDYNEITFDDELLDIPSVMTSERLLPDYSLFRPYITAIKSKPFLLLAGISGTGKSRIVRELARACWDEGSDEYMAQKPSNFEIVQVKPNWHDSSELIGYVSRVSGEPVFVAGDFLKFVAKAWENPDIPYFLCLDEMNLAPVEQYFAEYLSVVESRKTDDNGNVVTDPILKRSQEDWYRVLTSDLTTNDEIREMFLEDGIRIPQNLIVVGTVNMDETTFSFSRKVLDRAMTIEMNEVNLNGGLENKYEVIGKLGAAELIGRAVEGVDVYKAYKGECDTAIAYLQKINAVLEGTPFKIAYRTRNEALLYVVNNLPYNKNDKGEDLNENFVIARALDEITNMKILSRIEGDETKVSAEFLNNLTKTIKEELETVDNSLFNAENPYKSVSLAKLEEMKKRLESGYTSFWG